MLIDPAKLPFFLAASAALIVTPGPAVLYIVARAVSQGRRAGLASVLGVSVGALVHAVGAAAGLSAVLAASAIAFSVVQYLGAAYLIYLGLRKLLVAPPSTADAALPPATACRVFRDGVVIGVLNPKTALFFLAFLPQFVSKEYGPAPSQLLTFGVLFVAMALVSDSCYALFAGTFGNLLRKSRSFLAAERYVAGGVYVGLGVATALGSRPK